MPMLTMHLDTDTDTLEVMVDGVKLENVNRVTAWLSEWDDDNDGLYPEPHFCVEGVQRVGTKRVQTCITASQKA